MSTALSAIRAFIARHVVIIHCSLTILITHSSCSYERQVITGTVEDESGSALSGASVTACYSGWGWSSGYLVWDKEYCSEPVTSTDDGLYEITINSSRYIRLRAKKQGWIQTGDFNRSNPRIILTPTSFFHNKHREKIRLREEQFRKRLTGESATRYY